MSKSSPKHRFDITITTIILRRGNAFGRVCLSVCLSVCVSVRLCVWCALTFESLDLESPFLVRWHIFIFSRSSSHIKVIGSRSRSQEQKTCLCILFADGLPSAKQSCFACINRNVAWFPTILSTFSRRSTCHCVITNYSLSFWSNYCVYFSVGSQADDAKRTCIRL